MLGSQKFAKVTSKFYSIPFKKRNNTSSENQFFVHLFQMPLVFDKTEFCDPLSSFGATVNLGPSDVRYAGYRPGHRGVRSSCDKLICYSLLPVCCVHPQREGERSQLMAGKCGFVHSCAWILLCKVLLWSVQKHVA